MKAFDNSTRDPRINPGTGDLVIPAGKKKPLVPVWSGSYSMVFGNGGQNIGFVSVNASCLDGEMAEARISERRGLSIKFKSLTDWRKMMKDGTVVSTNAEPYAVWDEKGAHKQPAIEDPEYVHSTT